VEGKDCRLTNLFLAAFLVVLDLYTKKEMASPSLRHLCHNIFKESVVFSCLEIYLKIKRLSGVSDL